ncbi:UNKNOWN [Stylonychia lemnae]|uniref:Uncharacterized protein n=1 Tax=Stylonychia lemnae TaxID=5949 RepID=A0A077ZPU7_STYLE|nr:UNKNOWN [Stylonychia lemnae]|eukprot:CDW71982.1 UNKNOWN [Stylonychia lemnae]
MKIQSLTSIFLLVLLIFIVGTEAQLFDNYNTIVSSAAVFVGSSFYETFKNPRILREGG